MGLIKIYNIDGATFDAHTHSYRKLMQLGVDSQKTYASPARVDILDNQEVNVSDNTDLEVVGLTTETSPTGVPD